MNFIKESNDHILVEFTSENGSTFEVGYPKSAGYTRENIEAEIAKSIQKLSDSNSGYQHLKWVPNGDSLTSRGAIDIGIFGGRVDKASSYIIYQYQIVFINTHGWGFTFKDESGDTYGCSTPRNGKHTVNYNSNKPTIIGVR